MKIVNLKVYLAVTEGHTNDGIVTNSQTNNTICVPYVYWTVHHLDSRIKIDQLDVTCFIISLDNAQHVSDVNTSILRRLRFIC